MSIYQEASPPLLTRAATFIDEMKTGADGFFAFGVEPGTYYLEVDCIAASFTAKDQGGDDTVDSDIEPTSGTTIGFTLELGDADDTRDAGSHRPQTATAPSAWTTVRQMPTPTQAGRGRRQRRRRL